MKTWSAKLEIIIIITGMKFMYNSLCITLFRPQISNRLLTKRLGVLWLLLPGGYFLRCFDLKTGSTPRALFVSRSAANTLFTA